MRQRLAATEPVQPERGSIIMLLATDAPPAIVGSPPIDRAHEDPAEREVEVGELAPFVELQAGDGRFRYLHAKEGRAGELAGAGARVLGVGELAHPHAERPDAGPGREPEQRQTMPRSLSSPSK